MRLTTSPLLWDLDAQGNIAPTLVASAQVRPVTFNLSSLDGRTEDLWNYVQAIWLKVAFTAHQPSTGGVAVNADQLYQVVDSVQVNSPVLGDVLAQKSNKGAELGLIDQVIGAGYHQPVPYSQGIPAASGNSTHAVYIRAPLALDCYGRPQDFGPWAPLFEKGRVLVNIAPSGAAFGDEGATLPVGSTVTVTGAFEVQPFGVAQIHAPSKFVRYEFPSSGVQLKLLSFGAGDGFLGVNAGARLAMMLWLASGATGLGGVDTIDNWAQYQLPWRHQRTVYNPDFTLAAFHAVGRGRVVGNAAGNQAFDSDGWPYLQGAAGVTDTVLTDAGLFFPLVWPGRDTNMSAEQKQVGDLQINAGWTGSAPNGTHAFRTLEHYSFQTPMIAKIMGLMGYSTATHTAQPKMADNTNPRQIPDGQLFGQPLRILPKAAATKPVPGL